jgi:hypothetical protein
MSADAGKGSGSKTDDVLSAILKSLKELGAQMRSMEASTSELGTQQDTLSTVIECVDLAHTQLDAKVSRVETAQRELPHGRAPNSGRRRQEDDTNPGGDFVPTAHKLEFPKYDGNGDPLPWLNRCEHYFHVCRTPATQRVSFTAFYPLDDAHLWFHRLELNGGRPTWTQFVQLINARFGPPLTDSPIGELAMLRRKGTVDDYSKRFMSLSCRDPLLIEPQQIQLYITGLGDPLCTEVALQ